MCGRYSLSKSKSELEERFQKMNQKTFILEFDKTTSSYKEEDKLNAPNPQANMGGVQIISVFGGVMGYKFFPVIRNELFIFSIF